MLRTKLLTLIVVSLLMLSGCGTSDTGGDAATGNGNAVAKGSDTTAANGNGTAENVDVKRGFATPEEAFKAFKAAIAKDDWLTATGCLTDQSQEMMASIGMQAVGFATLDEKKAPRANALMKKYGIDPNGEADGNEFDQIDKLAFINEAFTFLEKEGDDSLGNGMKKRIGTATLKDLKIDGEKAQATLVDTDKSEPKPIDFKQIDGCWFIQLPGEELLAGPGGDQDFGGPDVAGGNDDEELWAAYPEQGPPPAEAISVVDFNAS